LERAKIYRRTDIQLCYADLKTLLTIDPNNVEAKASMMELLKTPQFSNNSLEVIVQRLKDGSSDVLEAAQKLSSLTTDASTCIRLERGFGLSFILDQLEKLGTNSINAKLRLELITSLRHCSEVPDICPKLLQLFTESTYFKSAFKETDEACYIKLFETIALKIINASSVPNFDHVLVHGIISEWISICSTDTSPTKKKVSALSSLVKSASTTEIMAYIFELASDEFYQVCLKDETKMLLVGLLARCCSLEADTKFTDMFYTRIRRWIDTNGTKPMGLRILAVMFLANPKVGADILQKDKLLEEIMDIVEFENEDVKYTTIEALSSACSDVKTRKQISMQCSTFFLQSWRQSESARLKNAASLALVKIMSLNNEVQKEIMGGKMTDFFMQMLHNGSDPFARATAVEAISYLSLHKSVKNAIAGDMKLLKTIGALPKNDSATQYGVALIYFNITQFPKALTEEEKQVRKLHALANASTEKEEEMETNEMVLKRIDALVESSAIPVLVALAKLSSDNIRELVSEVFKSIATSPKLRGLLVQAGSCKSLLAMTAKNTEKGCVAASHALSKIAISSDPNLAFRGEMAFELVRPLLILCESSHGLEQFEGLMALTNISGVSDDIRGKILSLDGLKKIQECQFSDHTMIRRAATECLCNMIYHPTVFEKYSVLDSTPLKIMIALADAEDFATKRAASGSLAVLSSMPSKTSLLMDTARMHEILVSLLDDSSEEILHRAVEICKNVLVGGYKRRKDFLPALAGLAGHKNGTISSSAREALSLMK
jgi:protein unc-45